MRKHIILGVGLALSLATSVAAQQPNPPRRGTDGDRAPGMRGEGRRGTPDGFLLKGITLTEGQRVQIAQLKKSDRAQGTATRADGRAQMEQLKAARERGDTAAVRAIMQRNRDAMQRERAQHIAAIRNILTVDQRVQFDRNVATLNARDAKRADDGYGPAGDRGQRGGKAKGAKGQKPLRSGR